MLFLSEHAFLIAIAATATIALFTLRADCGQMETQRIQDIHFLPSVSLGFSRLIACDRALFGAKAARIALVVRLGNQACAAGFLIGPIPRDLRGGHISRLAVHFRKDFFRKGLQLAPILLIRPSWRVLVHNGMLRNGRNPGDYLKAAL